jgi:integrase
MGLLKKDSPFWWLWLETAPKGEQREKTSILVGTTARQRKDNKAKALELYHQRMQEIAEGVHHMPQAPAPAPEAVTFAAFAPWYDAHHIAHHAGREREREILPRLVAFFGPYALEAITQELVISWRTARLATPVTVERFGMTRGTPALWRQVHALLKTRGPLTLPELRAHFGLSTRDMADAFKSPQTRGYFRREATSAGRGRHSTGTWAAVGTPGTSRHTYPAPSARTVNREVDLLQQVLSAAVVAKKLAVSPLFGLVNLEPVEPIRRTMSDAEEHAILAELRPDDRTIVLVGLDTLARLINILDLQWVDDHGQTLDLRDTKNGRSHTVPVSSRLRAALDLLPHDDAVYLFPRRRQAASDSGRRGAVAKALKRACVRAGVPYGRAQRGITFHWSTRRTGATRMIRRGGEKALGVVRQIGGWKTTDVLVGIYQETVTADMVAAVETVAPAAAAGGSGVSTTAPLPRPRPALAFSNKTP